MYNVYLLKNEVKVVCTFPTNHRNGRKRVKGQSLSPTAFSRARSKIRSYVECGNFTHFVTFTFSSRSFDRYDADSCRRFITNFLTRNYPDSAYLLVPELHSDGAIHFHGFISIDEKKLCFAGFKKLKSGRSIRLLRDERISQDVGRNTFERLSDNEKYCLNYVLKYVSKQFSSDTPFCSLYFCSRGLATPQLVDTFSEAKRKAFFNFLKVNNLRFFNSKYCSVWRMSLEQWIDFNSYLWLYSVWDSPEERPEHFQMSIFS